jgi:hypothetical protein
MAAPTFAAWLLEQDARALLTRLSRVKPFALQESMLPAAGLLPASQAGIEQFLMAGRSHLRRLVDGFLVWLRSSFAGGTDPAEAQRRFTMLRLRFNAVLTQFDLFNDVMSQRSENETGVWLSGLDIASADALRLRGNYFQAPPVICYLDRGIGAAIRRARTRLPGGGMSPVAIIKVPRERMVGSGIASSLFHEVGHQAAALLGLVESLRPELAAKAESISAEAPAWRLWERWISEIVADLWSVARAGVASTVGLMAVVSLPRPFVFRVQNDDPHPAPWIRVRLSAALGKAMYPQPLWEEFANAWESYYPLEGLEPGLQRTLRLLDGTIPALVSLLIHHRPPALKGHSLLEALDLDELQPSRLRAVLQRWRSAPAEMYEARPTLAFAAIGQGRVDARISPEEESLVLGKLLTHWAVTSTLQATAACAARAPQKRCGCQGHAPKDERISTRRTPWQIQRSPDQPAYTAK